MILSTQVLYWMGGGGGKQGEEEAECCWPVCSDVRNVMLDTQTKQRRLRG
jgi:hypothetical protein